MERIGGMDEHACKHDVNIALLIERQETMAENQEEMCGDIKQVLSILQGNGKPGLVNRMSIMETKQSIAGWVFGVLLSGSGLTVLFLLVKGIVGP
jgi:hypothetical protein